MYTKYAKSIPVDDKLCIFESFNGRNYSDSPKAVYNRKLNDEKYRDFKFIWVFAEPEKFRYLEKNHNTKLVESTTHAST